VGRYLFRRAAQVPVVLLVLVTVSFVLMREAPGGPFSMDKQVDPDIRKKMEEKYGLDAPRFWPFEYAPSPTTGELARKQSQYERFLRDLSPIHIWDHDGNLHPALGFDLGPSFKNKTLTVNEIIWIKGPVSALLGLYATLIALALGLGAGIVAGMRQNSVFDYGSMTAAMIGLAVPTFVIGPLLQLVFGMLLHRLPVAGYEGPFDPRFLILPSIALALPFAARIARLTRAGMLEVVHQDYIRTAWAKGLSEQVVIGRHALRGAMLPVVSFLGPAVAQLLTGSLVVEQVFAIPGIGREFVTSATNRDYTMVMGTVILFGVLLVGFNLLTDILYGMLDPRIRYS
jgi:oligopeptide transport system permease protein